MYGKIALYKSILSVFIKFKKELFLKINHMSELIKGWIPKLDPLGKFTKPDGTAFDILTSIIPGLSPEEDKKVGASLARIIFNNYFMPFAAKKWEYSGSSCNCLDLAAAFSITWYWILYLKQELNTLTHPFLKPEAVKCNSNNFFITKKEYKLFAPKDTNGNVRDSNGALTGRSYFAEHWCCKIGNQYFDPTFNRIYERLDEFIEKQLISLYAQGLQKVLSTSDLKFFYTRRSVICGPFSDSWNEITLQEAMKYGGQIERLPQQERIPKDVWQNTIMKKLSVIKPR
jgi:hypothetical protein